MSPTADSNVSPARSAAWHALVRLRRKGAHADDSVASLPELEPLGVRDRALANELIAGTLRRRGSIDAVLRQLTKAPLGSTRPAVLEALRVTTFQLLFLDRVPAYAAVDDGVALAAQGSRGARGFANAVLRRVAAEGVERYEALAAGDDNAAWSVRHSAPRWLVALLRGELGDETADSLLGASVVAPERCLRVNALKTDMTAAQAQLRAAGYTTRGVPGLATALLYDGPALERSAPFKDGLVTPQSRGSQMAAVVAAGGAGPDASILDLCAAPGTKTAQLAASAPGARITAVDVDEARLRALRANVARLGAAPDVVAADVAALPAAYAAAFDRVLLDAPCSGLGTLSSRPDLRWRRRFEDVTRLAALQRDLLAAAAHCVRPGGLLTYSVCTLPRAETLDVVGPLLEGGGWEVDDLGADWPGFAHPQAGGYLLVLPPGGGSSGFFIARLRRI
jgi:16S rRNA (cytosine967-C5)-methyltransferase